MSPRSTAPMLDSSIWRSVVLLIAATVGLPTDDARAGDYIVITRAVSAFSCIAPDLQMVPAGSGAAIGAINPSWCSNTRPGWLGALVGPDGSSFWPVAGVPLIPGDQVTTYDGNGGIVPDGAGGAIAFWRESASGGSLHGQHTAAAGNSLWGIPEDGQVLIAANAYAFLAAATDDAGGGLVAWLDVRPGASGAYVLRVDAAGTPLWTATGVRFAPFGTLFDWFTLVPDGAHGAWLIGRPPGTSAGGDLYINRILADGSLPWGVFGALDATRAVRATASAGTPSPSAPDAVPDGAGGMIVAWSDHTGEPNGDLYVMRVDSADGDPWGSGPIAIATGPAAVMDIDCAPDSAGGVIVAWSDGNDVFAQRIDALGQIRWNAGGALVAVRAGADTEPAVAATPYPGALVAWTADSGGETGVRFQELDDTGARLAGDEGVDFDPAAGNQQRPRVLVSPPATGLIMWVDGRDAPDAWDLYAMRFPLAPNVDVPAPQGVARVSLAGFAPNPASGTPRIAFELPASGAVRIDVLDAGGRRLISREIGAPAGRSVVAFPEARTLPQGIYWVQLQAHGEIMRRRGVLLH